MFDKIIQELESQGFSHIHQFLDEKNLLLINNFFDQHKDEFEAAKVGSVGNKQRVESIRGDFTYWLDPLNPVEPFEEPIHFLEQLREKVNTHFYLGLKQFECHLAYYPPGTFYKKHLDRFEKDSSRTLSFVFYLNQKWTKDMGGNLILYNKDQKVIAEVSPLPGSFICFLSEDFPHEVKSSSYERRSLTGWMHNKIIY